MPNHIHNYRPARGVQLHFVIQKMSYLIKGVPMDLSSMYSIKSVLSSGQKDKLLKDCLQKCQVLDFFIQPSSPSLLIIQTSLSGKCDISANVCHC